MEVFEFLSLTKLKSSILATLATLTCFNNIPYKKKLYRLDTVCMCKISFIVQLCSHSCKIFHFL